MPKVVFVTLAEYYSRYGLWEHVKCETARHENQGIDAIVVIAIANGEDSMIFGACPECFANLDNDLGPEANWHAD